MTKQTPVSRLTPGQRYTIKVNGQTKKADFLGIRMKDMAGFNKIDFRSALYGHRWIFVFDGIEQEFQKGWDEKGKSGLVIQGSNTLVQIFNLE